jgi:hypothetical protein
VRGIKEEENNMKKLIMGLMVLMLCAVPVMAEIGVDVTTGYMSRYIWRGYDLGDLNAEGSEDTINNSSGEQISIDYDLGNGFAANIWAYYANHSNEVEELDYTVSYGFSRDDIDYSVGYTRYTWPTVYKWNTSGEGVLDSHTLKKFYKDPEEFAAASDEIFIGATFSKVFLRPSVTWYRDYSALNDEYYAFGGGDSFTLMGTSLDYSIGAGYWVSRKRFAQVDLGISKTYEGIFGVFAMTPGLQYIALTDTAADPGVQPGNAQLNDQLNAHEISFTIDFSASI